MPNQRNQQREAASAVQIRTKFRDSSLLFSARNQGQWTQTLKPRTARVPRKSKRSVDRLDNDCMLAAYPSRQGNGRQLKANNERGSRKSRRMLALRLDLQ